MVETGVGGNSRDSIVLTFSQINKWMVNRHGDICRQIVCWRWVQRRRIFSIYGCFPHLHGLNGAHNKRNITFACQDLTRVHIWVQDLLLNWYLIHTPSQCMCPDINLWSNLNSSEVDQNFPTPPPPPFLYFLLSLPALPMSILFLSPSPWILFYDVTGILWPSRGIHGRLKKVMTFFQILAKPVKKVSLKWESWSHVKYVMIFETYLNNIQQYSLSQIHL